MESSGQNLQSPLLTIPRELRDEIFSYLVLPEYVFTSTAQRNAQSLHQSSRDRETFIDTRLYIPARPPSNVLSACRQLREDFLDHICRLANASTLPSIPNAQPVEESQSNKLAARVNQRDEDIAERYRDRDTVRITMEIKRPMRGSMGYFTPTRDTISPRLAAWSFLLVRLRRVKFVVRGGMAWWEGPPKASRILSGQRNTISDQANEQRPKQPDTNSSSTSPQHKTKIDPLSESMDKLLELMPNVEEVEIDVLIHAQEFLNWNLPENKREGISGWIEYPISFEKGRRFSKVDRRLMVSMSPDRAVTFYRRLEEERYDASAPNNHTVHISEGEREINEDWETLPEDPTLHPFVSAKRDS